MTFEIMKIEKNESKETYAKDFWPDKPDDFINELILSEFWAIIIDNKCYGIATVVENNDLTAKISHFGTHEKLFETDLALMLYKAIEIYCKKKNYEHIVVEFPAGIRGLSIPMRNFFNKRAKFDYTFKKISSEDKHFIFLLKTISKKDD
jgi:hypothetical protein